MSLQDLIILNEKCEEYEKEISTLKQREAKLVEALRFYADPETWFHECQGQSLNVIDANDHDELLEHKMSFDNELDCYQDVGGKKAREVLKELGVPVS